MFRRLMVASALLPMATCALMVDAQALDLNSFRTSHKRPPLHVHAGLAAAADAHARDLAGRNRLDHNGFRERLGAVSTGAAAENVSYGCEDEPRAIRQWSRSSGRRYWVLELGN